MLAGRSCLGSSAVDGRDLCHPAPPIRVLQRHDLGVRPVKVIGDEGYLLVELLEGVAYDPPSAVASSSNVVLALRTGHASRAFAPAG